MRGIAALGMFAAVLGTAACPDDPSAACENNRDCALEGTPGVCQPSGHCSYPDPTCASGLSYPVNLPGPLGGTCVPGQGVDTDDGTTTTETGTNSSTTAPSETSATSDTGTSTDTTSATSTSTSTDTGTGTSTGTDTSGTTDSGDTSSTDSSG